MSQPGRSSSGRGKRMRLASPCVAAACTAGPPGCGNPNRRAVLSKASPGASSMVPPKRVNFSGLWATKNWQWPPDTSNIRYGKATWSVSRGVNAWPAKWFTPINGMFKLCDRPFAHITPERTPPISPGPEVTAIPSRSAKDIFAAAKASSIQTSTFSACARAAISGTTPP